MTVDEEFNGVEKKEKKKNVLVGIRIDSHSREVLSWALVKVAEPGDSVIAVHVCRSSDDHSLKDKPLLDDYLEVYEGLCSVKKVDLKGQILRGNSVRKILVREAKNYAAVALVVGIDKQCTLGGWGGSTVKYCAKKLPHSTDVVAIHNGRIVYRRFTSNQLSGVLGDPRPSLSPRQNPSEFGDSEAETETVKSNPETTPTSQDSSSSGHGSEDLRNEFFSLVHEQKRGISRSTSLVSGGETTSEQRLGWPLLRKANSLLPPSQNARKMSVVQWVMSLPDRSPHQSPHCSTIKESPVEREIDDIDDDSIKSNLSNLCEVPEGFEHLLKTNSSSCKWFSLEVLKTSTSHFSSENLIGKGGCNRVYKGILPDGKPVAVKIMKSSKEAWKDFAYEVDIISSLNHKHITPLLGVCVADKFLISVYDFLPKGSLEENLHGKKNDKSEMTWEVRFNIAVGIAEALNYLHKECPQSVIHRDIKSSNILLSNELEAKLSDFGLAIWALTNSSFLTQGNVVGTFGYLAPEYFMYGKVSDKIDVYAFGVVLLELLSGRGPISSDTSKGQESLVMWAKPIIERGDLKDILDPDLDGKYDEVQMQRMALAATLCITQAARLRPNMSEVLKLLKGDEDVKKWMNSQNNHQQDSENQDENDDEVYPNSSAELHLSLALLDVDDDTTSVSSVDRRTSISLEEYFKGRWSQSSSFD
ncbi:protein kinase STUNTED isoform X1 [Ziziphus jujuba]|uniref:Protein kinase STUNTED isoform X1 n=2 Tax=Ziziphus jujuba TaxID=326968 RepID=A0A6P4AVY5_ZIZJJ|nr:protein kinase STUNTED isoform X1 [Ziziphus jujuba]